MYVKHHYTIMNYAILIRTPSYRLSCVIQKSSENIRLREDSYPRPSNLLTFRIATFRSVKISFLRMFRSSFFGPDPIPDFFEIFNGLRNNFFLN